MTNSFTQRVAGTVRAELARHRKSQGDLAAALGVSRSYVSRRLMGEVAFDVDEVSRIAEWLQISPQALLGLDAA